MKYAVLGALVTAAVSTAGDYLWANVLPHGRPVYWFAHAIVLFATVGACLGWPSRKRLAGAAGAALIGCIATLGFYLLQPLIGYSAMFVLFVALWLALGVLTGRVLQRHDSINRVLARSALAAAGSGLGFYAISGIWFPFHPHGWDYARHFVSWTVAYLPAFAALLAGPSRD
jgi:cobalamin biosynthesis protein CobD/CbiB